MVEFRKQSGGTFETRLPGVHNVSNALGAIAVGEHPRPRRRRPCVASSREFRGVDRRFEPVGEAAGVTVMDDYAHHPTEVRADLAAARDRFPGRRLVCLFQPHTYTRTRYLLDGFRTCFADCDVLLIAETYAAREEPSAGMNAGELADEVEQPPARYAGSLDAAPAAVAARLLQPGDVFFTVGAGDVDKRRPDGAARRWRATMNEAFLARTARRSGRSVIDEPMARHTTFGDRRAGGRLRRRHATKSSCAAPCALAHSATASRCSSSAPAPTSSFGDGGIRGLVIENAHGPGRRARCPERRRVQGARRLSGVSFAALARRLAVAGLRRPGVGLPASPARWAAPSSTTPAPTASSLSDVLRGARLADADGDIIEMRPDELDLSYRNSAFTRGEPAGPASSCPSTCALQKGDAAELKAQRQGVRRAAPWPRSRRGRNCGSVFKNPPEQPAW